MGSCHESQGKAARPLLPVPLRRSSSAPICTAAIPPSPPCGRRVRANCATFGIPSLAALPTANSASRRVSFSVDLNTAVEITPYSKIYGEHPKRFHFDRFGDKVPAASGRERWTEELAGVSFPKLAESLRRETFASASPSQVRKRALAPAELAVHHATQAAEGFAEVSATLSGPSTMPPLRSSASLPWLRGGLGGLGSTDEGSRPRSAREALLRELSRSRAASTRRGVHHGVAPLEVLSRPITAPAHADGWWSGDRHGALRSEAEFACLRATLGAAIGAAEAETVIAGESP